MVSAAQAAGIAAVVELCERGIIDPFDDRAAVTAGLVISAHIEEFTAGCRQDPAGRVVSDSQG
jgi:hypothetical protein